VGICAAALALVLLIVFMLQNTRSVEVTFLWMHGTLPLALALLIAAVGSAILAMVFGRPASRSCVGSHAAAATSRPGDTAEPTAPGRTTCFRSRTAVLKGTSPRQAPEPGSVVPSCQAPPFRSVGVVPAPLPARATT
jgi:hypothetical protein